MSTVILGAGIIGCSTAYFLSQSSRTQAQQIHLVEPSPRLFASASGYAAGFLARDWFSQSVAAVGALSFDLHKDLAEKHNGSERWGYSRSTGTSLSEDGRTGGERGDDWLREGGSRAEVAAKHDFGGGEYPSWLTRRKGGKIEVISKDDSTAIVDPLRLSTFLLNECTERGVQLHHPAKAVSVAKDMRNELSSIRIISQEGTETDIPCTRLIITAGAWTPQVFSTLFPTSKTKLPISSLAGHSLVVKSPRWTKTNEQKGCHAVFTTDTSGYSPEIFSRVGGEIWLGGLNSTNIPLPNLATETSIQNEAIEQLIQTSKHLLGIPDSNEEDLEIVRKGLCFRPVTPTGKPIIARIPDSKLGDGFSTRGLGDGGVFVAAGHGPWGISLSLGTGMVVAELVEGRTPSASVGSLGI
ncbi:MAG: hypothetical protein M1812_002544 [Candelaria pacifica]|nr:MAG: hypothetical protein M1812_002544 [Candelaria pacifica]